MSRVKGSIATKSQLRNLSQYKDFSDEEFDELYSKKLLDALPIEEYESRIQQKLDEFSKDYDLEDMNINDRLQLRTLAQAFIDYEDISTLIYRKRMEGYTPESVFILEKLGMEKDRIQKSISNIQNDLNITRKARSGDKDESILNQWKDIQDKAKKFYRARMVYIFCPKCNMLLGTLWIKNSEDKKGFVKLSCNRVLDDGTKCSGIANETITDLLEKRGTNYEDVPAYFR